MTQPQLISLLSQLPMTEGNRSMFEAIINTINSVASNGGTKEFPTSLTAADLNKGISIDGTGIATLYAASAVPVPGVLGQWGGKCTGVPAGIGSTIIMTIVDENDVVVNITNDDVLNTGPNGPITTVDEFVENMCELINNVYGLRYFAQFASNVYEIDELAQGSVAGDITASDLNIGLSEVTASVLTSNLYYDERIVDGVLVGINPDNNNAIVDITNIVYVVLGSSVNQGDLLFFNGDGTARELIVDDDQNSTIVQGRFLTSGNAGDVVPAVIAPGVYSLLVQLSTLMSSIGDLSHSNVRFVDAVYGDDTTAQLGRPGYAYQTLEAACADYQSGELIYVRSGRISVVSNILTDGLHIYCEEGCIIESVGQFLDADTTGTGVALSRPVRITGHARLEDSDGGGGGFLTIRTNPSAEFYLNFDSITVSNISNGMVLRDGTTYLTVEKGYTCSGRPFRLQDTANLYYKGGLDVTCSFGSVFNAVVYSDGMSWSGKAEIEARSFIMTGSVNNQSYVRLTSCQTGANIKIKLKQQADDTSGFSNAYLHCASNTDLKAELSITNCTMAGRSIYNVVDANTDFTLRDTEGTIGNGTQTNGVVRWKDVDVKIFNAITSTGGKVIMDKVKIDGRAFTIDGLNLAATGTAKLRNVNIMVDATRNSVVNTAGSTLVAMDFFANYAVTVPLGAVGQMYVDPAFVD